MITKALYNYDHAKQQVDINFYRSRIFVSMIICPFSDFSVFTNSHASIRRYWAMCSTSGVCCSIQISKRVFDYLNRNIAAYPNQDEIPF
jgi:hypothetical protein